MSDEALLNAIQALRADMQRGFASINRRLDLSERNYQEAVEVLPVMKRLETKVDDLLHHQAEGGRMAQRHLTLG